MLVVESAPPGSGRRLLDIVFLASEPMVGMEHSREPDLEPCFVLPGRLADLNLHPGLGYLNRLSDPGRHGYAAYVGNAWQPTLIPKPGPPS